MPPFGTCFRSKVGPGYALQAATHGISDGLFAGPGSLRSGLHRVSFGLRLHGRNGGNDDMEGAAGGSYELAGWRVIIRCAAVVCRITSKRAKVD